MLDPLISHSTHRYRGPRVAISSQLSKREFYQSKFVPLKKMFDILSILLAKTAYALLYAWLCLSLLLSEAFTPLIGASNPIVWAIGSAFVVARLILYLLQVFMRCIKSPITQCMCASTIVICTPPMLLKACLTFVTYTLLAKTAYALLYTYLGLSLLLSELFTPLIGASNPIVWTLGSAFVVALLIFYLLQVFMRCIKSPITRPPCSSRLTLPL